ncbi:outer membrane beta-barrel protein [Helicobacter pylori]|nr:outer membrane beta-barrel protein [Helicobacter pylori]
MKKHILSLALGSLLVSTLNAEDNGFFISAGYQIGEATQIVKSTGELKKLSDAYENLNNLANQFYTLNNLIQQSSNPTAINNARNTLGSSSRNLLNEKTNSPAYQAVSLALNAAVGFWNVIGYAIMCGNGNGKGSGPGSVVFNDQPGQNSTSITCDRYEKIGYGSSMSIPEFEKLNKAYQAIQQALKKGDGFPDLSNKGSKTITVNITFECKTTDGSINNGMQQFCRINGSSNGVTSSDQNKTQTFTITNNAQELLTQAANMMNVITTTCPLVRSRSNVNAAGDGSGWGINKNGNACQIFDTEISAVQSMIKNAQEIVTQSKIVNENTQSQIDTTNGKTFNPFTDASFAQSMLANAQAQAKMLNLADQVKKNLEVMENITVNEKLGGFGSGTTNFVSAFLASCKDGGTLPNQGVTSNTWGAGCAYVEETITALNKSIAYFGDQAQQIKHAQDLAYTLANFSSQYAKLGDNYQAITKALPNFPNALSSLITSKTDQNAPNGIKTTYTPDLNALNQLQTITQELGRNPFRKVGMIASSTTNNGAMNGIGFQVGYKQFFGQKKTWGARYYGFLDYNHAYIKSSFFNSASDVFTYGVGTDILYNFINDKATKNSKISFGLFGGIALAGVSWLNSQFVNLASFNNYYKAKVNVASFQFLFNAGLRMNLAKNKKKANDHAAQHGVELGVKIPTINTSYYSLKGTQLEYRRLYSVYLNYVFAY